MTYFRISFERVSQFTFSFWPVLIGETDDLLVLYRNKHSIKYKKAKSRVFTCGIDLWRTSDSRQTWYELRRKRGSWGMMRSELTRMRHLRSYWLPWPPGQCPSGGWVKWLALHFHCKHDRRWSGGFFTIQLRRSWINNRSGGNAELMNNRFHWCGVEQSVHLYKGTHSGSG